MQVLKSRLAPLTSRITAARLLSSKKDFDIKEDAIVISGEGVVVAWHPPKSHPYEHSRPIQRKLQDLQDTDSVLKVKLDSQYAKTGPTDTDIANMFHTSPHSLRPTPRADRIATTLPPRPKFRSGV